MSASMLCTDTIEALEAIDAYAPDIRAYIDSLRPPEWPFAIDAKLAGQGRQVFTASCSRCHGNYGGQLAESDSGRDQPASHYPNSLVPIDEIGTDATLIELAQNQGQAYLDWFQRSYYGELTNLSPAPGYVAPPLDGIWATAPYLHNGSVPSLRTLLDSTTRAQIWRHQATDASDPETYDTVNLGWRYDRISAEAYSSSAQTDARVFDTREPGHANSGHLFGDSLSDADRTAVIEYLKTL